MININRRDAPDIFSSSWLTEERITLKDFLNIKRGERIKIEYQFQVSLLTLIAIERTKDRKITEYQFQVPRLYKEIRPTLLEIFHGKCAFCESVTSVTNPVDIESFRPIGGAVNLDGELDPVHYAWLASNLS